MQFTQNLIWKLTNSINKYAHKEGDDLEILHYGMQVIIMNLFKFIILFVTAYLLNILLYTFAALVCFGIVRTFASGVHCKNSILCIIVNYIFFIGNVYLSMFLCQYSLILRLTFIISILLLLLYAPAETKKRPINKGNIKQLKIKSILSAVILLVISIAIPSTIYKNIITIAVLEESLCTTPLFYKIFY